MAASVAKQILFVCGTQRSGTSAICDLLTAHSDMIVCNERYFHLVNHARIREIGADAFTRKRLLHPVEDETQNYLWGDRGVYHRHLLKKYHAAVLVGDKVPLYHLYMDYLLGFFPSAKFLFLTRNIYDVANSWQKRCLDPDDTIWTADYQAGVMSWNQDIVAMTQNVLRHPAQTAVVSYERLYSYSPRYLRRVLAFLGVRTDDEPIYKFYKQFTRDWMRRFAAPNVLSPEQMTWVGEHADMAGQSTLIDFGEVA